MVATYPHRVRCGTWWDPIIQIDFHEGLFVIPPAPLPVPKLFSFHFSAGHLWYAYCSLGGEAKDNNKSVMGDGAYIVGRETKVGGFGLLPHINIAPLPFVPNPNLLIPLLILGSSSECVFAASSVRSGEQAVACSIIPILGINLACADPCDYLWSVCLTGGTVFVNFTMGDFRYGVALVYVKLAVSWAFGKVFGFVTGQLKKFINPNDIIKGFLRPVMNSVVIDKLFGRRYSYAMPGVKGFQSLADDYISGLKEVFITDRVEGLVTGPPKVGVNMLNPNDITNWLAGGDESF